MQLCFNTLYIVDFGLKYTPLVLLQKNSLDWKPENKITSDSDQIMLRSLDWNTEYEVVVVAENQQGKSKAALFNFRTTTKPTVIPGTFLYF